MCRECHDDIEPTCPYCQSRLKKRPKASAKCRNCGRFVLVNVKQRLFDSTILTAKQAEEARLVRRLFYAGGISDETYLQHKEALRARTGVDPTPGDLERELQPQIERHQTQSRVLRFMESLGASVADYERHEALLQGRPGRGPVSEQIRQSLWQELLERSSKPEYVYQALAHDQHLNGENPYDAKRAAALIKLNKMLEIGIASVRIMAASDSCARCRKQNGRVLSIKEAIRRPPIPCKGCTFGRSESEPFGWCRCLYFSSREGR